MPARKTTTVPTFDVGDLKSILENVEAAVEELRGFGSIVQVIMEVEVDDVMLTVTVVDHDGPKVSIRPKP